MPEQNSNLESFYKKENIDHEIFNFGKNILEYFHKQTSQLQGLEHLC